MKEKKIQIIIYMMTIINIIIILVLGYQMVIHQKYSRTNIRKILEKNADSHNYIIEARDLSTGRVILRIMQNEKARKEEHIIDGTTTWYIQDLAFYATEKDGKKYMSQTNEETKDKIISLKDDQISAIPLIDNASFFQYLKNEKYQNKKCMVIAISNSDTNHYEEDGYKLWIDIENGFMIKAEYNWKVPHVIDGDGENDMATTEHEQQIIGYNIEMNTVKDDDIEMPNLEDYILVESDNNLTTIM